VPLSGRGAALGGAWCRSGGRLGAAQRARCRSGWRLVLLRSGRSAAERARSSECDPPRRMCTDYGVVVAQRARSATTTPYSAQVSVGRRMHVSPESEWDLCTEPSGAFLSCNSVDFRLWRHGGVPRPLWVARGAAQRARLPGFGPPCRYVLRLRSSDRSTCAVSGGVVTQGAPSTVWWSLIVLRLRCGGRSRCSYYGVVIAHRAPSATSAPYSA